MFHAAHGRVVPILYGTSDMVDAVIFFRSRNSLRAESIDHDRCLRDGAAWSRVPLSGVPQ
jgi:hypothetical protein